jgi:hypothetical protein
MATIVKGLHVLYTGTNGRKTYGITVRATGTEADVEKKGFKREWHLNDKYLLDVPYERLQGLLGLSLLEHAALVAEAQGRISEEDVATVHRFTTGR